MDQKSKRFDIVAILKKNTMLISLFVVMLVFELWIMYQGKNSLFSPVNITNLINQNAYVVILAIGMLMCILTGGNIDLSIGSAVALIGALAGMMIVDMKMSLLVSILVCLLVGVGIGAWQGFWIAYMRIPAFIVTLAGMLTFRGITRILLKGLTISPFPKEFLTMFGGYLPVTDDKTRRLLVALVVGALICIVAVAIQVILLVVRKSKGYNTGSPVLFTLRQIITIAAVMALFTSIGLDRGIPVVLITLGAVVLFYSYYTSNTVPGRNLYAMGGNEKAAKLSGVNTNRVLFFAYANMGFLAAVAALVCNARFNSAEPQRGTNYEMDAIAACYIGGASAYGGIGTVGGTVIGAIFMGVLNNGMSIVGIDSNWQSTVKGLVLLLAVIIDIISHRGGISLRAKKSKA